MGVEPTPYDPSAACRRMPGSLTPSPSTSLRTWQHRALDRMADWREGPFLISAAPGAGKTRPALELAKDLLSKGIVGRVAVLCPTTPLTRQWASAAAILGVQLQPDAKGPNPPRDFHGVAVTYARVASDPRGWAAKVPADTLVIVDEAHHLGEDLAWGTGFQQAFASAPRWLLLSGTPFRSDATPIPGVRYDHDGLVVPDVSYTYAEAVAEGICRPVAFVTFDGTLSWRSGEDVVESSFETVLSAREASRRYRTAISTELPDGLPRILREADAKLGDAARGGPPRRGRPRGRGGRDACPADREAAGRDDRAGAGGGAAHRGQCRAQARGLPRLARAVDRGGEHGLRGRGHPAAARGGVCDGRQDAADLPPDRGAVRAHDPDRSKIGQRSRAELAVPARRSRPCAHTPRKSKPSCATPCTATSPRRAGRSRVQRRASEPSPTAEFVPLSAEFAAQMTLFGRAPEGAALPRPRQRCRGGSRAGPGGRVRASSSAAPGAQPPGGGAAPPRRAQPPRDQRLGQPHGRARTGRDRQHQAAGAIDSCSGAGARSRRPAVASMNSPTCRLFERCPGWESNPQTLSRRRF